MDTDTVHLPCLFDQFGQVDRVMDFPVSAGERDSIVASSSCMIAPKLEFLIIICSLNNFLKFLWLLFFETSKISI